MAAKKTAIRYEFRELPRGGEVRLTTTDPEAVEAIHRFMAFQREDHRTGGNR
jgi:TusA-related sulfurtransferase